VRCWRDRVTSLFTEKFGAAATAGGGTAKVPDLKILPPEVLPAVKNIYADATSDLFPVAAPIAFLAVLSIKEKPLSTVSGDGHLQPDLDHGLARRRLPYHARTANSSPRATGQGRGSGDRRAGALTAYLGRPPFVEGRTAVCRTQAFVEPKPLSNARQPLSNAGPPSAERKAAFAERKAAFAERKAAFAERKAAFVDTPGGREGSRHAGRPRRQPGEGQDGRRPTEVRGVGGSAQPSRPTRPETQSWR
jgi:hypothetical protein